MQAVVVVLGREMPGLCEEVLEVLQSLPDAIVSSGSATGELSRRYCGIINAAYNTMSCT